MKIKKGYEKEDIPAFIKDANVIVIVYDLQKPSSFTKYLPLLTSNSIYSIIVIGNKYDLIDSNYQKFDLEQQKTELEKYQSSANVLLLNL